MDGFETRFSVLLKSSIEAEISDRLAGLITPGAADFGAYKEKAGFVKGLQSVLDLIEALTRDMGRSENKPEKPKTIQRGYES